MNNTIIQQPPTTGKVIINTTMGELEIELWCKEIPKATRNFIQLCLEGYYDNTIFHRLIPDFIIQGGDPTGTGKGGESIYGKPFQDEFHQRLTFQQRGTIAMANAGPHDNGSQFFITFDACAWLDKKHTIFGKIVGNTIYNLMQMGQVDTDNEDKPLIEIKIIDTKVIINPFDDIVVRNDKKTIEESQQQEQKQKKIIEKKIKNTSLLSFQEEEEEEDEDEEMKQQKVVQSIHDVINDPKLKKQEVISKEQIEEKRRKKMEQEQKKEQLKQRIRNKDQSEIDVKEDEIVKKRKINEEYLKNDEDKQLLNYRIVRNEKKQIELIPIEQEEDEESSEYIEDEEKRLERLKQKEQYENLKAEILQFKKYQMGTYNEDLVKEFRLLKYYFFRLVDRTTRRS